MGAGRLQHQKATHGKVLALGKVQVLGLIRKSKCDAGINTRHKYASLCNLALDVKIR